MKILLTFLTEKKKLFWTNKKFVYLIFINKLSWYHPKITYENIVQKDMNKFQRYVGTCLVYIVHSKFIPITHCIRRIIQKIMAMLSWAEATNPWVCIVHNHWSLSNWCCQLLSNVSFPFNHHKQAFAFTTNPAADMDVLEVVELLTKSTQT